MWPDHGQDYIIPRLLRPHALSASNQQRIQQTPVSGSDPDPATPAADAAPTGIAHTTLDRWAIVVSGVCVVHCLAIPLTLVLMPSVSAGLAEDQTLTHWLLLAVAVPISAVALWTGHRQHPSWLTLGLGLTGLILLTLGVSHWLGERLEIPLTVVGGIGLIAAHWRNLRHKH